MSDFRKPVDVIGKNFNRIDIPTVNKETARTTPKDHVEEIIKYYAKQLTKYKGAEEKFRKAVSNVVNQFIMGRLTEKQFDVQVESIFQKILSTVKDDTNKDDRKNTANTLIEDFASKLAQYEGAADKFRTETEGLVKKYVNGIIKDYNTFCSQVTEVYNRILNEAIKAAGDNSGNTEKEKRQEYANNQLDDYVKKLAQYEGAADKFTEAVSDIVSQYINGIIDVADFDEKLEAKFKEIYNEEVTKARTARSNYAYGEVDKYAAQLAKYEGAAEKYRDSVQNLVDNYVGDKITKENFDKGISTKFEEVLQTAQTTTDTLGDVELYEYTEDTSDNRAKYMKSVIEVYSQKLNGYPFRNAINDLAIAFYNRRINKDTFDAKVQEIYAKIYASIAKTEELTEDDGSKIVKNYDAQGRVISETKCDKNGNKIYEKTYEYNEKGLVQKRVVTEYDVNGNFTVSTYDRDTGAIKRQVFYLDSNPYSWIGGYGEFVDVSDDERYNLLKNGKIKKSIGTLDANTLYGYIIHNLNASTAEWRVSVKTLIKEAVGSDPTFTCALLEAAQIGKGAPTSIGCTKTYETYMDTDYADFIRQELYDALYEAYGYEPEDVVGYFFPSDSQISKAMAAAPEMTSFVKNNIQKLLNGELPLSMGFSQSKDLYYSIASCKIMDSKLSGTTLTLTVFDIYDFDLSFIDKINTSNYSTGDVLNAAGAMAMKNGDLKPYYEVWEVKIDLTTIFSTDELKALGVL